MVLENKPFSQVVGNFHYLARALTAINHNKLPISMPALHASGMTSLLLYLFIYLIFMKTHMAKETNQQPPVQGYICTLKNKTVDSEKEKLVRSYTLLNKQNQNTPKNSAKIVHSLPVLPDCMKLSQKHLFVLN